MQEVKKRTTSGIEVAKKLLTIFIESKEIKLTGKWEWEMHADDVYCSDVMFALPAEFIGTKGIIHPDDIGTVKTTISRLSSAQTTSVQFRIITTYGEVKSITGTDILVLSDEAAPFFLQEELLKKSEAEAEKEKELERLRIVHNVISRAEKQHNIGLWYTNIATNETWYSDQVFRLYGLLPQSLNSHVATFASFIHSEDAPTVKNTIDTAFKQQLPFELEYRIIKTNGEERWVRQTSHWDFNNTGQLVVSGIIQDIIDERTAELALKVLNNGAGFQQSLARFMEQNLNAAYWYINLLTKKVYFSENFYRIYGLKLNSVAPASNFLINYVHPDDREEILNANLKLKREHKPPEIDYRIIRPDGKIRNIRMTSRSVIYADQEVIMIGTIQDVTIQKGIEKKIKELDENLQVENFARFQSEEMAGMGSWLWDIESGKINWSSNFYQLLGFKPNAIQLTQDHLNRAIYLDDRKKFKDSLELILKEKKESELEFRIVRLGEVIHLKSWFRIVPYDNKNYFLATVQNVTDLRQLSQQLYSRIQMAESLIENIPDSVFVTDIDNNIILWNKRSEQLYKIKSHEAINKNYFDLFPAHKESANIENFNKVLGGEAIHELGRAWNHTQHENLHLLPLRNDEDQILGILHIHRDVTNEIELSQNLKERLGLIESLVENSVDKIIAFDRHMNYLLWNKKCEEEYGMNKRDVIGKNILEVFPGFIPELTFEHFKKALKGETVSLLASESESAENQQDIFLIPIKDEKETVRAVLWMMHDLSKERQLVQEQRRAQIILNGLNEACLELDGDGNIIFANEKAEKFWGIKKEALIGQNIWKIFAEGVDSPIYFAINYVLQEKDPVHKEFFSPTTKRWIYVTATPTNRGVVVLFFDIHDTRLAAEKLGEEHRRLKVAQAIGKIGSFEWHAASDDTYWSDEMYRIHGMEPQSEIISLDKMRSFIHPDDVAATNDIILACRKEACKLSIVHRIIGADGVTRYVSREMQSFADEAGNVTHLNGTVQDITEQVEAQQRLNESNALLRNTEAIAHTGSYEADLITGAVSFSDGMYLLFGEEPQSFHPTIELIDSCSHPDDAAAVKEILDAAAINKQPYYYTRRIRRKDGEWRTLEAHGKVVCNSDGIAVKFIGLVQDITERKKAEQEIIKLKDEAAQMATDRYLNLFNSIDEGFYQCEIVFDESNNAVDIFYLEENPAAVRIIGRSLVGKTLKEVNPQYETYWVDVWADVALKGGSKRMQQYSQPDDKWFDFYISKVDHETSRQVAVVFRDITERKKAEQALQEVNSRLVDVLESTTDAFYAVDKDFNFTYVNSKAAQLWNRDPNTLIGKHYWTEFPKAVDSDSYHKHYKALKEGKPVHYQTVSPLVGIWIDVGIYPGKDGGLSVFFRDVTEQKKTEESLKNFATVLEQQIDERTRELQKNLAILQHTEELAQIGSWEYEIATGQFNWSEGMYRLFGLPQGVNVTPETYLDFSMQEDRSVAKRIINNLKKKHKPFEETMHIKREDASRLLKIKASLVHDEKGVAQKIVGVDIDITDIKEAEEKVKESEDLLQQTTLATPDAIIIYDLVKRVPFYLNNCLAEWIGYTSEELVSMGYEGRLGLIHPDDREALVKFNEAMKDVNDGEIRTIEYRLQAKDGKTLWVRNRSKVFRRDEKGVPTHMMSVLQDFTHEVSLRQALTQRSIYAESLIDASLDRLLVLDMENRIVGWNKRCEETYHARKDEALGKDFFELFPKLKGEEEIIKGLEDAKKGEVVRLPVRKEIYCNVYSEIFYVPLKDEKGNVYAILNVLHDITKTFVAKEELKEVNKTLAKKNIELESKNEEITSFAFIASHDLREPLRKIHTFSDWLLTKEGELLSQQGKDFLLRMNLSVKRLGLLIDDILALTQIHAVKDGEEDIDLTELLQQVEVDMHDWIQTKGGVLSYGKLHHVKGVKRQLLFLLRNLISNAIKFSREGEPPRLVISTEIVDAGSLPENHRDDREYLKLSFTDNGIGINEKFKKKIFQMFQRLNGAKQHEGTGMGLAICKKIMENHHGFITVTSEENQGSVFCCYFPME